MVEIAGGIVLAVAALFALPVVVSGVILGICWPVIKLDEFMAKFRRKG